MEKKITSNRVCGTIEAPSSKSYAQRALAAALLCRGESTLSGLEMCNDTLAALSVVEKLGARVKPASASDGSAEKLSVTGGIGADGRLSPLSEILNVGESGLSARLFTPIAALCDRRMTITGKGSLTRRPLSMMEEPLRRLGVEINSQGGFLPIAVRGPLRGGEAEVDGSLSSQFITGMLMALPLAEKGSTIRVHDLKSKPYIDMTIAIAETFGVRIEHNDYREFFIPAKQCYTPATCRIEGDWSGASCLLVAGAVAGEVTVEKLNPLSLQADRAIIEALARAGAEVVADDHRVTVRRQELRAFEFDATHCPDLFPALAALAANCEGESLLYGTHRLTHKESDRAATLAREFSALGIPMNISQYDVMRIRGGRIAGGHVESHNDHRIAMAMAVMALNAASPVTIRGAEAVSKSYPGFWDDLDIIVTSDK